MNKYTVGKATQGLANYIVEKGVQNKGVAISYDSRRMSMLLAALSEKKSMNGVVLDRR